MNFAILSGRLATAPELSYTPQTQTACCRFNLAVTGRKKEQVDYIRITVWGQQAENVNRYVVKGQKVVVHGSIKTGSYTDKNGNKRDTFEVVASSVEFGEKPKERNEHVAQPVQDVVNDFSAPEGFSATDDYVPF